MGNIKHASNIDLSSQGLTEIPDFVFKCRNLKSLNLSKNKIKEVPLALVKLKYLKKLDLSDNLISQIFAKTFDLASLQILNLNNNKIKTLPKQINRLKRLKELHISGNQLELLPGEFSELFELTKLNISKNRFQNFPLEILSLTKLTKLWIGGNLLNAIPLKDIYQSFSNLKALYTFTDNVTSLETDMNTVLLMKQKGNVINDVKLIAFSQDIDSSQIVQKPNNRVLPKNIFISYSHKDIDFHNEVEASIKGLQNTFPDLEIDSWSDTRLRSGDKWEEKIEQAIDKAGIIILITSRHFLASDFIMKSEVPKILSNAKSNGTLIMNLIAGKCIAHPELKRFQYVNSPDTPLNSLSSHQQDVVYTKLQEEIKGYFDGHINGLK